MENWMMLYAKENTPERAKRPNVFGEMMATFWIICQSDAWSSPNTSGHAPGTGFCTNMMIGRRKTVAGIDM